MRAKAIKKSGDANLASSLFTSLRPTVFESFSPIVPASLPGHNYHFPQFFLDKLLSEHSTNSIYFLFFWG